MKENPSIQKRLASILLVVCLISFLPKSWFHDVVANHTDTVSCSHPGKQSDCVHPQGYQCGFTDWVVTAPYVVSAANLEVVKPIAYPQFHLFFSAALLPSNAVIADSRGPPSVA